MTDALHSPADTPSDRLTPIGTDAPPADHMPVGNDDKAIIGVFDDFDAAQAAVERLAAAGFPVDRISIIGKDRQSETRISGDVTLGDIAGPSVATGAWVGGLFGLLAGSAFLFIPRRRRAHRAWIARRRRHRRRTGRLVGGAVGAVLGHFVSRKHLPKYEELVRAGKYLLAVYGTEDEVARAQTLLAEAGSTDIQRHDDYRGNPLGPITQVREGMTVLDADGTEIGKVSYVRMGDPDAVTTVGEEAPGGEPHVAGEIRDRLLRIGFIKIDRKGFLRPDAYAAADEIDHVQDGRVHLLVHDKNLLNKAV